MQTFSSKRSLIRFFGALFASITVAAFQPAHAVSVNPGDILPGAVFHKQFGLNFAINNAENSTIDPLDYGGKPGCGGTCIATTTLGSNPSVFATVNEVVYQFTSGGAVEAKLGYYVAYLSTPGTHNVTLHAIDNISVPSGDPASVSTHLTFGPASTNFGFLHNFASVTFEEGNCVNGCPPPGFISTVTPAPFVPDHLVSMEANTLYFLELDLLFRPFATNNDVSAMIDPAFFEDLIGGQFVFSPGVFGPGHAVTPVPAALPLFISGLGGLGLVGWRRKRAASAA